MGEESPQRASAPTRAVFLSYASQDAGAARRICEGLRADGIDVWFDQSELRGGEAWDRKIRKQIHDCALFIPVISANAHARDEGYFRLEWKLAIDRSHLMAPDRTFLLPVVIDNTPRTDERIPDRFRELQWSRLPDCRVPPDFVQRVQALLSHTEADVPTTPPVATGGVPAATPTGRGSDRTHRRRPVLRVAVAVVVLGALSYLTIDMLSISKHAGSPPTSPSIAASAAPAAFSPPPHSIAVLPFVNMSGDKEQEYFSDGLTEELLDSLSRIGELQVAARTSAFSFKGKDADISTIAHKLNVAAVLEGSVRRSEHTVRITTQLINAVTGFHVWSHTYDRDLGDVLKLQTEIATAVASALKVNLLGDMAAKIEVGGTRNPTALDAYLRASKTYWSYQSREDLQTAIAGYTEAIHLDPDYALAYADRSRALGSLARNFATGPAIRDSVDKSWADAQKAIVLAPELAAAHLALASRFEDDLEFTQALEGYERALALEAGSARVLRNYGWFAVLMGQTEAGLAAAYRSVVLDPLNPENQWALGASLLSARRYTEAIAALTHAKALSPGDVWIESWLGIAYDASGDFEAARTTCEGIKRVDDINTLICLVLTYDKLGRHADAETALARLRTLRGSQAAVAYAGIYAQRGDITRALDWLETAMRQHDPNLRSLKVSKRLDPLRNEPRFQAIERALKFPDRLPSNSPDQRQ